MNGIKILFILLTIALAVMAPGIATQSVHAAQGGNGGCGGCGDPAVVIAAPIKEAAYQTAGDSLRHTLSEITSNPNLLEQARTVIIEKMTETADQLAPP